MLDGFRTRHHETRLLAISASMRRLQRQLKRIADEAQDRASPGLTDDQYTRFEDAFRGSFDEIERRLEVYVPFVARTADALGTGRVLDLGCGRGEWLGLLHRAGYEALGVDSRPNAVSGCQRLGLNAVAGEALAFARTQPADAWTAITAFHLVEHIATGRLLTFFMELFRVLQPRGMLLVETPNLSNVLVGSCYFHLDPTHKRPLPPETWQFLLSSAGFVDIVIMPLNPSPQELGVHESGSQLETRFNDLFYGPRDLGLIAVKPADQSSRR
jgi:O-antigen chain-terminating methyltransferase